MRVSYTKRQIMSSKYYLHNLMKIRKETPLYIGTVKNNWLGWLQIRILRRIYNVRLMGRGRRDTVSEVYYLPPKSPNCKEISVYLRIPYDLKISITPRR